MRKLHPVMTSFMKSHRKALVSGKVPVACRECQVYKGMSQGVRREGQRRSQQ